MEQESYWHCHLVLCRRLSILQIDSRLRSAAVNGHRELRFSQGGDPVWQKDPKLEADALDPELWKFLHAPRPITDTYKRGPDGELLQVYEEKPPNPQIMIKAASSLLPEIYGERSEVAVSIGGVVRNGAATPAAIPAAHSDFTILADHPELVAPPKNVLAVAEPCESIEEYEQTFGGKRLVEAPLFYNEDGTVQPPRAEIVIVEGSELDIVYTNAGIKHRVTSPAALIAEGYVNPFLLKLAPPGPTQTAQPSWPINQGAVSRRPVTGAPSVQWREADHTGRGADPSRLHGGGARVV